MRRNAGRLARLWPLQQRRRIDDHVDVRREHEVLVDVRLPTTAWQTRDHVRVENDAQVLQDELAVDNGKVSVSKAHGLERCQEDLAGVT